MRLFLRLFPLLTLMAGLLPFSDLSQASDTAREQRWATQLEAHLRVGKALYLNDGQGEFLALYTPALGKTHYGGVILLHGLGAHPDWPEVIAPLRGGLPKAGWATLSIQLPVRPMGAEFSDYLPLFPEATARIAAAVAYLQQQGLLNIGIVGQGLGAAMGAYYLAQQGPSSEAVRAFVGIGMNRAPGTVAHTPDSLAKIRIPVLDIYGESDLRGVLDSAAARALSQAQNPAYRQLPLPGADHLYRGLEATLVKRVASWLKRQAPSNEVTQASTGSRAKALAQDNMKTAR